MEDLEKSFLTKIKPLANEITKEDEEKESKLKEAVSQIEDRDNMTGIQRLQVVSFEKVQEKINSVNAKLLNEKEEFLGKYKEERQSKIDKKKKQVKKIDATMKKYAKIVNNMQKVKPLTTDTMFKLAKLEEHKARKGIKEILKSKIELEKDIFDLQNEITTMEEKYNEFDYKKANELLAEMTIEENKNEEIKLEESKTQKEEEQEEQKETEQEEEEEEREEQEEEQEEKARVIKTKSNSEYKPVERNVHAETKNKTDKEDKKEYKQEYENNEFIKVFYSAKYDKYMIENANTDDTIIMNRKDIKDFTKEQEEFMKQHLKEKSNIDFNKLNVDKKLLMLLRQYDSKNNTHKAAEYLNMLIKPSKEDLEHIKIEYDLKGLYDRHQNVNGEIKNNFKRLEKVQMLKIANSAKEKGLANVKKGFKVAFNETLDKLLGKIISKLPAKKTLPKPEIEETENATNNNEEKQSKFQDRIEYNQQPKESEKSQELNEQERRTNNFENVDPIYKENDEPQADAHDEEER